MTYDPIWRPVNGTGQNLSIGASSVQSSAFGTQTYAIRVTATGNCHIRMDQNPTAVATDLLLKSTDPSQVLMVAPGQKIAVIQDGASTGTLNVVELSH